GGGGWGGGGRVGGAGGVGDGGGAVGAVPLPAGALPGLPVAAALHAAAGAGADHQPQRARGTDRGAAGEDEWGAGAGVVPAAAADGGVGERGWEGAPAVAPVLGAGPGQGAGSGGGRCPGC